MVDRLADVEARLAAIESRLCAIEGASRRTAVAPVEEVPAAQLSDGSLSSVATYLGRILLIFGGAYLLRAITDLGILPTWAGIPLGASYALFWLYMAYRTAAHDSRRGGALVYGAASLLLALPILIEAVTRFQLMSGAQSAIALAVCCSLYLLVGAARDLRSLAWLSSGGGLLTAVILAKAAGAAAPFTGFGILLGMATLWAVYLRQWRGLQWLGAAGANLGIVALAVMSANPHWAIDPLTPYLLGLAMWASFLLSFAARSHLQGRPPGIFESLQALAASTIAFVAALLATRSGSFGLAAFGIIALALGLGAYALAFTPQARSVRGRSHYFYSTLGLALLVGGSALVFSPAKAAVAWALLAVGLAWASGRHERVSLSLHCTLLLIAACAGSGVLRTGVMAFGADPLAAWPPLVASQAVVAFATVSCLFIRVAQKSERWGSLAILPQLVVLALAGWSVGGLLVTVLAPMLADVPGPSSDPGRLAALRTAVLAASAVTLAISSRHWRWPEARWLAYPVLVLSGIKLLLEDFPSGRPLTLFVALALVGGALILVSKTLPRSGGAPSEA